MSKIRLVFTIVSLAFIAAACGQKAPEPYGVLPTAQQVEWQKMEMNLFTHFGPNTFTSAEWGDGTESADIFAPTALDCRQWARIAKDAGMKGIIITAKHHDGFCLWPNPVSRHTVAQSSWRDGKGDILKELSEACAEAGLKFGVYISPWDRNDPTYGTDQYNEVFCQTLESALNHYGPVFEQWFDGACGEGPNGKRQVYDWPLFHETVYKYQPDAIMFSDIGPGCRWIGNEAGKSGETNWSKLDTAGYAPGQAPHRDTLNCGNVHGKAWIPGEADVSIRPGWFWKASENDKVKTVSQLLDIYYASVGRNSLLLLNVPPDTRGLIHENDESRLKEFRAALDEIFAVDFSEGATASASVNRGKKFAASNILDDDYDSYWAAPDNATTAEITINLDGEKSFNRVMVQEYIPLGQRVAEFKVDAKDGNGEWKEIAAGTTIGYKRILLTDNVTTDAVRIRIEKSYACPVINGFGLYQDDIMETPESVDANKGTILKADEPYTIDLKEVKNISGFLYEPMTGGRNGCIITYSLDCSEDGKNWTRVFEDKMFDNIVNNPVLQDVSFPETVKARYVRITPLRTSEEGQYAFRKIEVKE